MEEVYFFSQWSLHRALSWGIQEFLDTLLNWFLWNQCRTIWALCCHALQYYDRGHKFNESFTYCLLRVSCLSIQTCMHRFPWETQSILFRFRVPFLQSSWSQNSLDLHHLALAAIYLDNKSGFTFRVPETHAI